MKRLLLSMLASGICAGAMAIPAKPGIIAYTQPDGTVINILLAGDEHGHLIYSESGRLLVESNGRMEYAKFDEAGYPVPSGISVGSVTDDISLTEKLQPKHLLDGWTEKMIQNKETRIRRLTEIKSLKRITRSEEDGQEEGESRLVPLNFGRCDATFPVLGEQKGLVILVEYQDVPFDYGDYDYFNRMLNEEGFSDYGSLGSARDWFIENSGGLFLPDFDVYGPVKLPNNREYYGGNSSSNYGSDSHPEDMAIHACQMLDEEVDFSQYDRDGDGCIDNVFIFFAGKGEHDSGITNAVWPHSWDIRASYPDEDFIFDGVSLNHYACTCEYPSGYKRPDGIGTFVHEFGHVMGLPDLYNTMDMRAVYTPCAWSVMDKGSYNNFGLTPPNYSSYEKCALGWIDFQPFTEGSMELPYLNETNIAYALPTDKADEFFFFENRQQRGNDEFLPGHGMIVWHIDYRKSIWEANTVNNIALHQYVDLVEADNVRSADSTAGDAFPGTKNVTTYNFDTKPQLATWGKKRLAFEIEDISESEDGLISFNSVSTDQNGVDRVESSTVSDNVYYDLTGRRVANPGKGIYIRDGKKILVK
ncbi:MAG: M6 family metalloprotease domain-containing protein [Muribaculaceae bacterium]|nr:M6 family metalloprotease domain-containing protein [Muribaculaceae bacterium]